MANTLWKFIDDQGMFVAHNPHKLSRLYFPLANEAGIMSSITPNLHGDIKLDHNSFVTVPVSADDLQNTLYNRNIWVNVEGLGAWPFAFGDTDESLVEAGGLWHKSIKINKKFGIKVEVLNFIPVNKDTVELMEVTITNISNKKLRITSTIAIPIYARSADRIRDHRHVSSLLNRVKVSKSGVVVTPTMSFEERGHMFGSKSYFVVGCDENARPPIGSFPTLLEFCGEGNSLLKPDGVLKNIQPKTKSEIYRQGKEAIGALKFKETHLPKNGSLKYIICTGAVSADQNPEKILAGYNSSKKIEKELSLNKRFWSDRVNALRLSTGTKDFDRWMCWVGIQPFLRRIFGCSFLPDFDYGRGGRGWRDLWQDSLTLLLSAPDEARQMLINNFGGVRIDGSNATIIGKKPGEFVSDRNNISRTWMDHGLWPFMTVKLYIDQTGDFSILDEKAPFFESSKTDTILKHILVQHEREFTKIGANGNFMLEGADWNDGLDMAGEKGESAAFTSAYAGNLMDLAGILEKINYKKEAIDEIRRKADNLIGHIRKDEWITVKSGYSFFNGYYDNSGNRVEGDFNNNVRMTLTGQVFPIMSGAASPEQALEAYKSAKKYLWDPKLKGFRLNTDFKEIQPNLGRAFSFAYGEKENGAFFSHMNVMFAYALYKRGFVKEGYEVLDSIYNMCLNTKVSKIYPCIPEYFNSDGRGLYSYLTGSASWLMFTMLTQVFGIRGDMGNLVIDPKLVKGQFGKPKKASINTTFAGRHIRVDYFNPGMLDYGSYKIEKILINNRPVTEMPIKKETFLEITSQTGSNSIEVYLETRK